VKPPNNSPVVLSRGDTGPEPCCTLAWIDGTNFVNMPALSWQYGHLYAPVLLITGAGLTVLFRRRGWLRPQFRRS
jgi:hypothetical protein